MSNPSTGRTTPSSATAAGTHHNVLSYRPLLSDFILGSQDGLVNVLGIVLGITAASSSVRLIYVAALAALGAESISMGAVAYTSTLSRRMYYLKNLRQEQEEMREVPETEKEEVREILRGWGYGGEELEELTDHISRNPKAMLRFMMSFELNLAPVSKAEARRSFVTVFFSTVFGSIIPLIPYAFTGGNVLVGASWSVIISGVTLFLIGWYEAKTTVGSVWWHGLQMMLIGLTAGFAGFLIGHLIGATSV